MREGLHIHMSYDCGFRVPYIGRFRPVIEPQTLFVLIRLVDLFLPSYDHDRDRSPQSSFLTYTPNKIGTLSNVQQ